MESFRHQGGDEGGINHVKPPHRDDPLYSQTFSKIEIAFIMGHRQACLSAEEIFRKFCGVFPDHAWVGRVDKVTALKLVTQKYRTEAWFNDLDWSKDQIVYVVSAKLARLSDEEIVVEFNHTWPQKSICLARLMYLWSRHQHNDIVLNLAKSRSKDRSRDLQPGSGMPSSGKDPREPTLDMAAAGAQRPASQSTSGNKRAFSDLGQDPLINDSKQFCSDVLSKPLKRARAGHSMPRGLGTSQPFAEFQGPSNRPRLSQHDANSVFPQLSTDHPMANANSISTMPNLLFPQYISNRPSENLRDFAHKKNSTLGNQGDSHPERTVCPLQPSLASEIRTSDSDYRVINTSSWGPSAPLVTTSEGFCYTPYCETKTNPDIGIFGFSQLSPYGDTGPHYMPQKIDKINYDEINFMKQHYTRGTLLPEGFVPAGDYIGTETNAFPPQEESGISEYLGTQSRYSQERQQKPALVERKILNSSHPGLDLLTQPFPSRRTNNQETSENQQGFIQRSLDQHHKHSPKERQDPQLNSEVQFGNQLQESEGQPGELDSSLETAWTQFEEADANINVSDFSVYFNLDGDAGANTEAIDYTQNIPPTSKDFGEIGEKHEKSPSFVESSPSNGDSNESCSGEGENKASRGLS